MKLDDVSLKVRNFKCFAEQEQGFDRIKPINVIIGRNNSGKSTLLDLINFAAAPGNITDRGHRRETPEVFLSHPLTVDFIDQYVVTKQEVRAETNHNSWPFNPHQWSTRNLNEKTISWTLNTQGKLLDQKITPWEDQGNPQNLFVACVADRITVKYRNPFSTFQFRRILADRDIVAETSSNSHNFAPNGTGLTNVIQRYLNLASLDRDLVKVVLLDALNSIFRPDADFLELVVRQKDSGEWEIYLNELSKGLIPMSQTGSGLKTVLFVLANRLLIPEFERKHISEYLFCFEELENNLHPAIQRRLFQYLRKQAVEDKCHLFITTHSHVVIDMFSSDDQAQILHVTHDGTHSKVTTVDTHASGCGVLEDLDIRASDLLQTNVVVWVEGPSDRFYFARWIELWSEGKLVEGVHYQCLPFGGSCNAHFSFDSPEHVEELIPALRINRNAILLIDSDRRSESDALKVHTERLIKEVLGVGGYAWETKGKEVENYIPPVVFQKMFANEALRGPGEYSDVLEYVGKHEKKEPPRKTDLAHRVVPLLSKFDLASMPNMAEQLDTVCEWIRKWNRLL